MRNLLIVALAGSGLLLPVLTAGAQQYQPPPDHNRQIQQREGRDHDLARYDAMFDHIRRDLNLAHSRTLPLSPDRARITRALQQLNACQTAFDAGHYDRRQLDGAIATIDQVANRRGFSFVTAQTRDKLLGDSGRLQRMESNMQMAYQSRH